jgi:hypothetical protein
VAKMLATWRGDKAVCFGAVSIANARVDWVADKTARLERIRAAKASLEAKKPPPDDDGPGPSSGMR